MARHDYAFPPDWDAMTSDEKSDWMTQERCRRQAMNQKTAFVQRVKNEQERLERRVNARNTHYIGEDRANTD